MFEKRFYRFCEKTVSIIKGFTWNLALLHVAGVVIQVFWRGILGLPTPWNGRSIGLLDNIYHFCRWHCRNDSRRNTCPSTSSQNFVHQNSANGYKVIYNVVFIGVCSYLAFYGAQMCLHPLLQKQTSIATGIPRVYIYMIYADINGAMRFVLYYHLFFIFRNNKYSEEILPFKR